MSELTREERKKIMLNRAKQTLKTIREIHEYDLKEIINKENIKKEVKEE